MSIDNLKLRSLKYDLAECISKFPTFTDFIKDSICFPGGEAWVFDRLAASLQVEFGELQIMYHKKLVKAWAPGSEGEKFFQQESAHGRYHHALNKFIEPSYVKFKTVPVSANKLVYPYVIQDELLYRQMLNPTSEAEKANAVKTLDLLVGAFEANYGILYAISLFEVLDENFDQIMKSGSSLVFLYLWVYHQIEEIEHSHIAGEEFEKKYNESMFSKENMAKLMTFIIPHQTARVALFHHLGLKYGFQFDAQDLDKIPSKKRMDALIARFRSGVKFEEFADQRKYFIDLGDNKWLPEIERHIGEWLGRQNKKSA